MRGQVTAVPVTAPSPTNTSARLEKAANGGWAVYGGSPYEGHRSPLLAVVSDNKSLIAYIAKELGVQIAFLKG